MNYQEFFDRVYVLNLDRREDRYQQFLKGLPEDWPFKQPERVTAIDGQLVPSPEAWKAGNGAWGCYRSHVRLIEDMLNRQGGPILLLEDDAIFEEGFTEAVKRFIDHIPDQWDMLYLGGQHLREKKGKPRRLNEYVYEPYNVNRTHAFAVQGGDFGRTLYRWLHKWEDWKGNHHIDHHLGRLHETRKYDIFCPNQWLVGQREGKSNINGRTFSNDRFWKASEKISAMDESQQPFYAILGLHSSGSSVLAGVCYHLGMHLGNKLVGYYGSNPETSCGFEAIGLMNICEQIAKLSDTERRLSANSIESKLRWFINQKRKEASKKGTIAGGKYPQLCVCGPELLRICGDRLRVIVADRPLEDSILSIQKRTGREGDKALEDHQRWLYHSRETFLASLPASQVLRVAYRDLLESPDIAVERISAFTSLTTDPRRAIAYIDPQKQHVDTR